MAIRFFLNGSLIMSALQESPAPGDGNGARGACPPGEDGTHFGENAQRTQPLLWAYESLFGFLPISAEKSPQSCGFLPQRRNRAHVAVEQLTSPVAGLAIGAG
jgi:hypothetical protein